ncbi:MAG TPA: SMP-30/gluconolactonase/LRE family protein [Tepidisphaeraceae bacterium]|nr:SMP-30/gluconolactonase/LRE family protein [Tepidisphaeraceae bacterium]
MPRPLALFLIAALLSPVTNAADKPAAAPTGEVAKLIAPGAAIEKVASDYKFTEGPAADPDGNVYFTDQPNDRILMWDAATNKIDVFLQPAGRSNGLCFDKAGRLIACADDKNELWAIDPKTKAVTVLVKDFGGKLLNGPNDVWAAPDGALYFTDPLYKREYWKRDPKQQQDVMAVYLLPAGAKEPRRVATDLKQPNGIVGTADGKTLYVADIGAKKTFRYTVAPDGALIEKKLFCDMGSDGMTLDAAGNLYLTGKGVTVFAPTGDKLGVIDVPEGWTANICFGGKSMDTLFITASKSVYTLKMTVKGAGSQ